MAGAYGDYTSLDQLTSRGGASHPNPAFDFLTGLVPRKLKDLFRWVEYLYYNSAHIFAALKKFAEYPITTITVDSPDEAIKKNWERVLNESIGVRSVAIKTGLDLHLYGNSFISVYKPFNRFLKCNKCNALTGIKSVKYKYKHKSLTFSYICASCNTHTSGKLHDMQVADETAINIIRWDPKLIDINHNPITDESIYYYTIPRELRSRVEKGDAHVINTMPVEFLKAIAEDKVFEFAEDQVYHMRIDPPAGIESQWGFPPLTATIKLFLYASVLRKANEAIALEHIVPFRVLHPAPSTGNIDPAATLNLDRWRTELDANIRKWRRDPLHIMYAPIPLGVTMMGGQGRSLLTLGEVKDAEDSIIAAMGIPREFLYGGMSFTGSAITLRMLENQLQTYTQHLEGQLVWIVKQVSKILSWKPVKVSYVPFKLIDDVQQKQSIIGLNAQGPVVSNTTLLSLHDLDLTEERDKREQEMLDEVRSQTKVQKEITKLQTTLAAQAEAEAQQGAGLNYNPLAVIAKADSLLASITSLDPGSQRSMLTQLSTEDPVMYAVVKDRMQTNQTAAKSQAVAMARQGGGQG